MRRSALLLLLALPAALPAQRGEPCAVEFYGVVRGGVVTTSTRSITMPDGSRQVFVSGGVDATCAGQGNRLLADSAEHYADRGELILINHVRYREDRLQMQSDRMVYYTREERLLATGNVRGRTNTGTRFTGPQMEYLRAKPGVREFPSWRAPGRPFVRMAPTDTAAASRRAATGPAESDSVDITADLVVSQNDSLVWASGNVVIERHDMRATGDSAAIDQGIGLARLLQDPRIVGRGERPFTMIGTEIDVWSKEQRLERILAGGTASVVSDSLTLRADTLDLRFEDQLIHRVFAWGGRATADTPQQQMESDSLDILMPGQRPQEIHALRRAIAHSTVDTARIVTDERDWIAGDTIVALFDTAATGDTTRATRMRRMTATGGARAFYQLAPTGGAKGAPNISYNRGREIVVSFRAGEVAQVDVRDRASGLFLEPIPADTARSPTDGPASRPAADRPAATPVSRPAKPTVTPEPKRP